MQFGARQEDNTWRLCIKYGPVMHGTAFEADGRWADFTFSSRDKANACATELNKRFGYEYDQFRRNGMAISDTTKREMVRVIGTFGTVTMLDKPAELEAA